MAETKTGAYVLALQYSYSEMQILEKEIVAFQNIVNAIFAMEKAGMLSVESKLEAELFQLYKGAIAKLKNLRSADKKRQLKFFKKENG